MNFFETESKIFREFLKDIRGLWFLNNFSRRIIWALVRDFLTRLWRIILLFFLIFFFLNFLFLPLSLILYEFLRKSIIVDRGFLENFWNDIRCSYIYFFIKFLSKDNLSLDPWFFKKTLKCQFVFLWFFWHGFSMNLFEGLLSGGFLKVFFLKHLTSLLFFDFFEEFLCKDHLDFLPRLWRSIFHIYSMLS